MSARIGLGIDVGGTFAKLVLITEKGKILRRAQVPSRPERGPRRLIERLAGAVRGLERGADRRAEAVCLAVAGDVDAGRGVLRRSPNLSGLEGASLRDPLGRRLGRPVTMHNDANMAAWGCYAVEFGHRYPDVLALTMGTGIGGGIVLGRRLYEGATGSAGEFGHMKVRPGGERCHCGARGCLEAYAGGYGVVRTAERLLRADPGLRSRLRPYVERGALTPQRVSEAARRGDRAAREVWERVGEALGVGIVNLVYLFNPDAVAVTGGVSGAGPYFLKAVRRMLRSESFRRPFGYVRVRVSKRSDLGVLGAGLYALEGA